MDLEMPVPETVSQHRFWPGGLGSVVAGRVREIPLAEKAICRGNKAQGGFNGCEGPQPSKSITAKEVLLGRPRDHG